MSDTNKPAKKRIMRTYPVMPFKDVIKLAEGIQKYASGQKVRRLTLFEKMKKSPESGTSRKLITNSNRYGLTKGSYTAEHLELTPEGKKFTDPELPISEKTMLRFQLSIEKFRPFKLLYEQYLNNRLPAKAVMRDFLIDNKIEKEITSECIEIFTSNAIDVGILKTISGAERIIPIEHVLEELPKDTLSESIQDKKVLESERVQNNNSTEYKNICFYIAPIGSEDSEHRKHSDLFLSSIIEPAVEEFNLKVIRADAIGKPGMITKQIIEHIVKSKLVIADLSYHNPNVFYELSLRHICRLPTVQVIRSLDKIPFDLDQYRTVKIDTTDIYSLVPKLEIYKTEIAMQVRNALEDADEVDNPISTYFPELKVNIK